MAKKKKGVRYWALKIFIITLILTAGISVISESLMGRLPTIAAAFIIMFIILVGVTFDVIGIAFATCEVAPFVAMASKKIKRAKSAIRLLKNADIVSNICGDVVGDICGIVSGAAGVAVAVKVALLGDMQEIVWVIVMSSIIAALTVAGKAIGKTLAIRKNKQIVSFVSSIVMVFVRDENGGTSNGKKQD
jgi:CBS domain containing-hemolysin-like protein